MQEDLRKNGGQNLKPSFRKGLGYTCLNFHGAPKMNWPFPIPTREKPTCLWFCVSFWVCKCLSTILGMALNLGRSPINNINNSCTNLIWSWWRISPTNMALGSLRDMMKNGVHKVRSTKNCCHQVVATLTNKHVKLPTRKSVLIQQNNERNYQQTCETDSQAWGPTWTN